MRYRCSYPMLTVLRGSQESSSRPTQVSRIWFRVDQKHRSKYPMLGEVGKPFVALNPKP